MDASPLALMHLVAPAPPRPVTTPTNCDREPIHVPGAIQPHGFLLVLDPETLAVRQASANSEAYVGLSPEALLGRDATAFLPDVTVRDLREALAVEERAMDLLGDLNPFQLALDGPDGPALLDVVAHVTDAGLVLEMEPAAYEALAGQIRVSQPVRRALAALEKAETAQNLLCALATEVRRVTGFDRVMVYRFDADWHGEVVAESVGEGVDPFLGLHFPASDIPAQARALYAQNRLRLIAAADYEPVPVVPDVSPATGQPLDLSQSTLRSVSPVHLRYLRNMGVAASMSVSIVREGKLWGLVACHHREPRVVPLPARLACDLIAQVAAMQLGLKQDASEVAYEAERMGVLTEIMGRLGGTGPLAVALTEGSASLIDLVEAEGAAVVYHDVVACVGETPSAEAVLALAGALGPRLLGDPVAALGRRADLPRTSSLPETLGGVLAASFDAEHHGTVLWFRPEVARTVTWSGDPNKGAVREADGTLTLTPRASFAAWQETVRGSSRPWTPADVRAASDLRRAVVRAAVARAEALARSNAELAESNAELDAFSYAASHDLREPLRGIQAYARFLEEDASERLTPTDLKRIAAIIQLSGRLDGFIDALIEYSRVGHLTLAYGDLDLGEVVQDARDLLMHQFGEKGARLVVPDSLPTVRGDAARLGAVFTNLFSNALKYNESDDPVVEVGCLSGNKLTEDQRARAGEARQVFYVRDNGIGIPTEQQGSVFQIFHRLHGHGAYGGGSGAGLTITRRIVERHGGAIWIEPSPGGGTTFLFTLEGARAPTP